ncbi:nuclear transport factor 2 family protein [Labilibaculum manganireducens]|uniref:nuclear transport factor 2 family protein n=1 Tax=Labilibaculum manganireducens TaxID=1940525 RepID=UPI0029F4FC41|nr:nuclear transport factor 2 family protein [Labilibaculum manganireducens]
MAKQTTDESQIINLIRLFIKLMIDRDTSRMNEIVDENLSLTHITGYVQPKKEWFAEIVSESMKYYSAQAVFSKADIKGDKAKCVVRHLLDARIWGSRDIWRLQQTFQLEKRDEKWLIRESVATIF